MGGGFKFLCLLLIAPFLAAISHDIYASYFIDSATRDLLYSGSIELKKYQISDLGYILLHYAPGFYRELRLIVGEETWILYVDPLLQQYSFLVALIPIAIFSLYLLVAAALQLWPFGYGGDGSFTQRRMRGFSDRKTGGERRRGSTPFRYTRR